MVLEANGPLISPDASCYATLLPFALHRILQLEEKRGETRRKKEAAGPSLTLFRQARALFSAAAARTRAFKAFSSILSPS
jgi:hypothetical protein